MPNLFIRFVNIFGKAYKTRLIWTFLLSIVAGLIEIFGIALIFPFISMVSDPSIVKRNYKLLKIYDFMGFHDVRSMIYLAAIIVGGVFIVKNIFMIYYQHLQLELVRKWRNDICHLLMQKYLTAPYLFHLKKSSSYMMNVLGNTVSMVINFYIFSSMNLVSNLIVTLMLLSFILVKYFLATVIAAVIMIILTISQGSFIRRYTKHVNEQITKTSARNLSVLSQALAAIKETKTFVREEYFEKLYAASNREVSEQNMKSQFVQILPMYINEIVLVFSVIAMSCMVLVQAHGKFIDVANLAVLAGAAFRLAPMVNRTLNCYAQISISKAATLELLEEVHELDTMETEVTDTFSSALAFKNTLVLDHIHFRYNEGPSVALVDVSLKINKGEFVGIIGASGAGKTTLVDIILGLLRPTGGEIYIDDTRVTTQNLQGLRKLVGYVSQSPYIFSATVRQNVAFGVSPEHIDEAKVIQALKFAQLYDLYEGTKDHIDTQIGENGKSLSGGQRQRLAIARALYSDPEILVLDEATSALDVETENEITQVINTLKTHKTVIAIAHRISTLRECSRIIYMGHGNILDIGTFKELQEKHESFSRIVELSSVYRNDSDDASYGHRNKVI